jgi:hypothetical protein
MRQTGTGGYGLPTVEEQYESLIETVYAGPLFKLVETLEQGRGKSSSDAPSPFEYNYAAQTIILAVLLLEAYLNLSRHLTGSQERGVLDYYNQAFPTGVHREEFTELVVLSEILAHDLRWRGQQDGRASESITPDRLPAISAHAFHQAVDVESERMRRLGLPIVPTFLTFAHARRAIQAVAAILRELRATLPARAHTPPLGAADFGRVEFRGRLMSFLEAADAL